MDFCFIHAADLHLDTPFQGVSQASAEVAAELRDASLKALDGLVDLVLERDAAFLLLAGDIYDLEDRSQRAQLRLHRGLSRLAENGIPTFMVHGNHDPLGGWPAVREWPKLVTSFGSGEVGREMVERDGDVLAVVHGISYSQKDTRENLALRFPHAEGEGLQVGLLHCNLGGNTEHEAYSPCSVVDLERTGMDYWALGHLHKHQNFTGSASTIAYSGNTQGRSMKPAERGEKGALVVQVRGGKVMDTEFVALDHARFMTLTLDVSGQTDLGALRACLSKKGSDLRQANPGRGLVVRVYLQGRGPVHRDLVRRGAVEDLVRDMREEADAMRPFLWWEGLRNQTRLDRDLDALRKRDDFSGEIMRVADSLLNDQERRTRLAEDNLSTSGRTPGDFLRYVQEPDAASVLDVLEEARDLALDLLEES